MKKQTIWNEYNGLLKIAEKVKDKKLRESLVNKIKKYAFAKKRKDAIEKIEDLFPPLILHLVDLNKIEETHAIYNAWKNEIKGFLDQINFRYNEKADNKHWLAPAEIDELSRQFIEKYYPNIQWKKLSDFPQIKLTEKEVIINVS